MLHRTISGAFRAHLEGAFVMELASSTPVDRRPADGSDSPRAFTFPIGATSPLWLAFAGAASVGVAYWWMTRWAWPPRGEAEPVALAEIETLVVEVPMLEAGIEEVQTEASEPVVGLAEPVTVEAEWEWVVEAPKPTSAQEAAADAPEAVAPIASPITSPVIEAPAPITTSAAEAAPITSEARPEAASAEAEVAAAPKSAKPKSAARKTAAKAPTKPS
jgi:hypothetical protein